MTIQNYYVGTHTDNKSHDGTGMVSGFCVFGKQDFSTPLQFIIHTVIPPGASIGYHAHGNDEEIYLILTGNGIMTVEGETRDVKKGDVIVNKPFGSHGLVNKSQAPLEILVFEVGIENPNPSTHKSV